MLAREKIAPAVTVMMDVNFILFGSFKLRCCTANRKKIMMRKRERHKVRFLELIDEEICTYLYKR